MSGIYVVNAGYDYEGESTLAAFNSIEEAIEYRDSHTRHCDELIIIRCNPEPIEKWTVRSGMAGLGPSEHVTFARLGRNL